jgi:hypothetical protein
MGNLRSFTKLKNIMTPLYPFSQAGFIAVTLLYYALFILCIWRGIRQTDYRERQQRTILFKILVSLLLWFGLTAILSQAGFFSSFEKFPPPFFLLLIVPLAAIIYFISRPITREILGRIPLQHLIYLQTFRIIVEVLLWMLFMDNLVPVQMTFEGRNFDVLAGLTSIVMGYLVSRGRVNKQIALIWNFICLGLLANIVTIAILSTPTPMRVFMNEPANTIVTEFPIVFLPAALVPLAYGLHFLSIIQLRDKGNTLNAFGRRGR